MSYPCRKQREKTISGYLDDPELLATCAPELNASGKYSGIYMTLSPSNSALLARCCNRVEAIPKNHLPTRVFSLPYSHCSLIARSEALRCFFVWLIDGRGYQRYARPLVIMSITTASPGASTLRRWSIPPATRSTDRRPQVSPANCAAPSATDAAPRRCAQSLRL
jgi:hypothetical protein